MTQVATAFHIVTTVLILSNSIANAHDDHPHLEENDIRRVLIHVRHESLTNIDLFGNPLPEYRDAGDCQLDTGEVVSNLSFEGCCDQKDAVAWGEVGSTDKVNCPD